MSNFLPMSSNLVGRVKNTPLLANQGLMPLFEAIVNSIHSIEDANLPMTQGKIIVEILRDNQLTLSLGEKHKPGPEALPQITGFRIIDNGIGFTDANLDSFQELDSMYKEARGCRGIGRITWLKAFDVAIINSTYIENGVSKSRNFTFSLPAGMSEPVENAKDEKIKNETIVELNGFIERYRKAVVKTADAIARAIVSHCSWYYLRPGGCPDIKLVDDGEILDIQELFDFQMGSKDDISSENISISGQPFNLNHIKIRTNATDISHSLFLCAGQRLVQKISLKGKLPGLFDKISDDQGNFIYACYITSDYLDSSVRPERTSFDLSEKTTPGDLFFGTGEVTLEDIQNKVTEQAQCFLGEVLKQGEEDSKNRLDNYVNYRAPRYKSVIRHMSHTELYVDPTMTDRELELLLHKKLTEVENELISEGHNLLKPQLDESVTSYGIRLKSYLEKAKDLKESDLANYVFHRRLILDILRDALAKDTAGNYSKEEVIHQLIIPMREESGNIHSDDANLWIIDERLAFHTYLASDIPIKSQVITDSDSKDKPDICVLDLYDNPLLVNPPNENYAPVALTIIEFKRPMRNDAKSGEKDDPIEQALSYLQKIREGKVKTPNGRPINNSEDLPGFCYVIADLTPTVVKRAGLMGLQESQDKLGYFGYNPVYKTYIEVISFDKLLDGATKRNKAFFEKLGLPTA